MEYDIIFVEDEIDLGNVVSEYLKLKGFILKWFKTAAETLGYYRPNSLTAKLIIIDVQLPGQNGFDLATEIIKINPQQTFLFLTARSEKNDRLRGLSIGAVDYIAKPFEIDELVLRIGNIINKLSNNSLPKTSSFADFELIADMRYNKKQLYIQAPDEEPISLTVREAALLDYLLANRNEVVKKKDILLSLWGNDDYFNGKSLEVFISRLRRIFKRSAQISIENIYGLGYMLRIK